MRLSQELILKQMVQQARQSERSALFDEIYDAMLDVGDETAPGLIAALKIIDAARLVDLIPAAPAAAEPSPARECGIPGCCV